MKRPEFHAFILLLKSQLTAFGTHERGATLTWDVTGILRLICQGIEQKNL